MGHRVLHHDVRVQRPLKAQHERRQRVEEVDPRQAPRSQLLRDVRLKRVDDGAGPEPGGHQHLHQVLGVAQVDVHRREEHGQSRAQHQDGQQRQREQREVGPVRGRVEHDHEDDHDDGLKEEEDAGRADGGQGEDLPGERDLLHEPRVVDHHPGGRLHPHLKEVPDQQAREEEDDEVGHAVLRDELKDDEVDGQRHGRRDHRPDQTEDGVLVLDLDLGADQVDEELARAPDVRHPPPDAHVGGDHSGQFGPLDHPARSGAVGRRGIGGPRYGAGRRSGNRAGAGRRRRHVERHPQEPPVGAADRSMTWSMNPYSRPSSAVNQRSRSESASIRSIGWPVWNAMRSAIIRLR